MSRANIKRLENSEQYIIGQTYSIAGMITAVKQDNGGRIEIEINNELKANISDFEDLDSLKAKAFEQGVFLSKVVATEPKVELECEAVFFEEEIEQQYH